MLQCILVIISQELRLYLRLLVYTLDEPRICTVELSQTLPLGLHYRSTTEIICSCHRYNSDFTTEYFRIILQELGQNHRNLGLEQKNSLDLYSFGPPQNLGLESHILQLGHVSQRDLDFTIEELLTYITKLLWTKLHFQ